MGGCRGKLQPMGAQQGYGFEKCLHGSGGCDHFFFSRHCIFRSLEHGYVTFKQTSHVGVKGGVRDF